MLYDANFDLVIRLKLTKERLSLSNKNCNLKTIQFNNQQMTRYEVFCQELPAWTKNLSLFGKAGMMKIEKDGKEGYCGVTCIFVNYSDQHSGNCYQIYKPETKRIIAIRCNG